jgi:hypothetical protein
VAEHVVRKGRTPMSKFFATSAPGFFGSPSIRRFLSSQLRAADGNPTRVLEEPVTIGAKTVQSSAASIARDRDHFDERLDAVAGSEFVDDRIRRRE